MKPDAWLAIQSLFLLALAQRAEKHQIDLEVGDSPAIRALIERLLDSMSVTA